MATCVNGLPIELRDTLWDFGASSVKPLAVLATGMITGVGFDAPSSCAAMRCALDRFEETRFMDNGGKWIIGSEIPLDPSVRGREKQLRMTASVITECLPALQGISPSEVPILLCVAEAYRPGRIEELDQSLLVDTSKQLKIRLHPASVVIANGRVGGVEAVRLASELIEQGVPQCLIVGVDSFLVGATLSSFEEKYRLLTSENSDGFIPGEAGAAVLLGPAEGRGPQVTCLGVGFGQEPATVESEAPLRSDGFAEAIRLAMQDGGTTFRDVDYRICDVNGEQYGFRDASLGLSRTMRILKPTFEIWHPADCIGEIGAAIVPCVLGVAQAAAIKGYAPGKGALCHFGNDDGARAAMIVRYLENGVA